MRSDVDLIILSDDPRSLTTRDGWWSFVGDAEVVRTLAWGIAIERRLRLPSGLEVDIAIAPRAWAGVPLDPGTRGVLSGGVRSLFDPEGLLGRAYAALDG
jgi:hypothetical protein